MAMETIPHPELGHLWFEEIYRWNTDLLRWEFWCYHYWAPSSIYTRQSLRPDCSVWTFTNQVISYDSTWAEPIAEVARV